MMVHPIKGLMQRLTHTANKDDRWKLFVLIFMAALYPLVVIPGERTGFTLPKYVALALAAAIVLYQIIHGRVKVKHPAIIPLGAFLAFALVSTLLASDQLNAWFGMYRFTGFCTYLFCIILFLLAADFPGPERIVKWMAASAALVSCIAVLQYLGFNFIPHYIHRGFHAYATMGNRNFMGSYAVFILPAAIFFYLRSRKGFWLCCAALIYAGLLVTLTRGAWAALPVPLFILLFHFYKERKRRKAVWIICITLLLVTCLLAPFHDWKLIKRTSSIKDQVSMALKMDDGAGAGRFYIWKEAIKMIPAHWAFGVGPDNLDIPLRPTLFADKVHNIYIEIAVTMGLFAFISYLLFLSFFLRPWKNERGFLFFLMILTYLIQGFFNIDVVAVMPLFWITLGLSLSSSRARAGGPPL